MSAKTLYVTDDGLVYNGRSYRRGDVIALDKATEQLLLEDDRVSTTEPTDPAPAAVDPAAAPAPEKTIADFSDEDLLAAVTERDIAPAPAPRAPFNWDSLDKPDLETALEARKAALEVAGTGKGGDVLKADLVKTLATSDAALEAEHADS